MNEGPVQSLFGIPLVVRRRDAEQLVSDLAQLWVRQMDSEPADLQTDLDLLKQYFDPLATGTRLRKLLSNLPPLPPVRARLLRDPLVLTSGSELLVTLEGRFALDLLKELLARSDTDIVIIDPDTICIAEQQVGRRYRGWGLRRIDQVLKLMSGDADSLRAPSIAWLLFLLLNGSDSPSTAVIRPDNAYDQEKFERSIGRIISAFADTLAPGSRNVRHYGVYQGYALTEARRRLPGVLEGRNPYIVSGQEDRVLELLKHELSRPQRSPDRQQVLRAFDAMIEAYREERPQLALLGIAHEKRSETRNLRQRLEDAFEQDRRRPRIAGEVGENCGET